MAKRKYMKLYKIYNTKTKEYSKGGECPYWGPEGKTWLSRQRLRSHFRVIKRAVERFINPKKYPYDDCVVEEITYYHVRTERSPISHYLDRHDLESLNEYCRTT